MLFIAGLLVCLLAGMTVAGILHKAGLPGFKDADGFGAVLIGTLSFQGAAWILIYFFLRLHQMDWRAALGLRGPQVARALLMGATLAVLILPVVLLLQVVSMDFLVKLHFLPEEQTAVSLFKGLKHWWQQAYFAIFAIVIAPVAEEFIFRGMLYPFIKRAGSPRLALFGVSALFALIHFDLGTLLPLFVLALALTWLYEKTDNLLAPMLAHSLFNAANLVLLLVVELLGHKIPVQS